MRKHLARSATGALAAALALHLVAPPLAQAQFGGYGSGYYLGGSNVQVVIPDNTSLCVQEQTFSPTLRGLRDLCQALPHLCQQADSQQALANLQSQRRRGLALQIGAGVAAVGGIGVALWSLRDSSHVSLPGVFTGLGLVVASGVAGVVGAVIMPDRDDVRSFVNTINRSHKNDPIKWGLAPTPNGRGLMAALHGNF